MKKRTSALIEIINQGRVKEFVAYISAKGEISEAVKRAVFKSKKSGIIKAYINGVFPAGSEFYKHTIAGWASLAEPHMWRGPTMTENERRAQDTLDKNDLIRRAVLCGGMIASFFSALLVFTP